MSLEEKIEYVINEYFKGKEIKKSIQEIELSENEIQSVVNIPGEKINDRN